MSESTQCMAESVVEQTALTGFESLGYKKVSKVRNRVIARVFRKLGLMEEWGSGYRRVLEACQKGGYPDPEWQELGSAFRVTFYPHPDTDYSETDVPVNVPVNERQQWFLNQLEAGESVRGADLAHYWNVTEKTAKRDIADLKKQGIIEFVGSPKTGKYRLKEEGDVTRAGRN